MHGGRGCVKRSGGRERTSEKASCDAPSQSSQTLALQGGLVLRALGQGIDGVMILGCHPGDCHYATGNYYAQARAKILARLLALIGLDTKRVTLDWVSAGEGERFASLVTQVTDDITALGPLGHAEGLDKKALGDRLAAAKRFVSSGAWRKGRWLWLTSAGWPRKRTSRWRSRRFARFSGRRPRPAWCWSAMDPPGRSSSASTRT